MSPSTGWRSPDWSGPASKSPTPGRGRGDVLVLTKPIGTGVITTAGKQQQVEPAVLGGAIRSMRTLNHAASDAMTGVGVNACVDVTGFGLVGHLLGLLRASNVCARVAVQQVPVLDGVRELLERDIAPGGTRRNLSSANRAVMWDQSIDGPTKLLMCDAQTSGGLLMAVPPDRVDDLMEELKASGVETRATVGEVLPPGSLGGDLVQVSP